MKRETVTVLDLGNSVATCLVAEADESNLRAVCHATVPNRGMKRGAVADLAAATQAVEDVLKSVRGRTGEDTNGVVLAVGGAHIEGHNAQGFVPIYPRSRPINREDVLQVINHSRQMMIAPDREQIQALPREFRIDGQRGIQHPIGMNGSKLEVLTYIVTGQTAQLQNLEKAVTAGGYRVEQMVLKALACGLAVLDHQARDVGCAVVDIGGGTTEVGVFSSGALAFAASLPVGSQLVTSDVSKLVQTAPEEAERLKVQHGCALAKSVDQADVVDVLQIGQSHVRPMRRRVLCEIIESRMREVASMVRQQIERSGLFGMLPGGIVLTGRGALLPGCDTLFGEVLSPLRVSVGAPEMPGLGGPRSERIGLSTVCGLARFALESTDDELVPASGVENWKDRIRTLWSLLGGRA